MKRRNFLKNTAYAAIAISTTGFIRFDGKKYLGDCETTSDILGPFYRPGSPVRNNFIIPGEKGQPLELFGIIKHNDCTTPYKNAKIELWHCDTKGVYDNTTDEFRYRGTTYSGENGQYSFKTILPVAYDIGNGHTRPAHFHLMITAEGYQPLITQLYFTGDKFIPKDPAASSPNSKRRILEIQNGAGGKRVLYDVSMSPSLLAEPEGLEKLTGVYVNPNDVTKTIELFSKNHTLWMKNEVYGESFTYAGTNTFEYSGSPAGYEENLQFEVASTGAVHLKFNYVDDDKIKHVERYEKKMN